jgi:hypothetical protein
VNLCPIFEFVRPVTFGVRLTYNRSGREVKRIIMDDYEAYKQRMAALSGAIFLFGLAALFLADAIFPAILLLIWVSAIPVLISEEGWKYGLWILLQMGIWMGGIPLLLTMNLFFPGVLVLAGSSALIVAIAPPDRLDKQHQAWRAEHLARLAAGEGKAKRKREWQDLPLPPADEDDQQDDDNDYGYADGALSGVMRPPSARAESQRKG